MTLEIKAEQREPLTKGGLNKLRKAFKIPGIVFGHGSEPVSIVIGSRDFEVLFGKAGSSSLIDIKLPGSKTVKALISEVQRNPMTHRITHVDFHQVRMDEKIKTQINLEFTGEAPAVKELGGNLIINMNALTIECLPADLISTIVVDISRLSKLDDSIHVRELNVPKGMTILDNPDGSVVSVLAPRQEAIEETPTPVTEVAGEKEKTEGQEAAPETESTPKKKEKE